MNKVMMIDI